MFKQISLLLIFINSLVCFSQGRNAKSGLSIDIKESSIFKTDIPNHLFDIILGRPTFNQITLSILANQEMEGFINYGLNEKELRFKSKTLQFHKGAVSFIELMNLKPNSKYHYQLVYRLIGNDNFVFGEINYFQTARNLNGDFTFTIQADSHLDENTSTEMYVKTLNNMKDDHPDFMIDLGDTWMTDKYRNDYKDSYQQYIAQRYYFGILGNTASVFLTLGNHDGESGQHLGKPDSQNMTNWATQTRRDFYPNPFPNNFYSGNVNKQKDKDFIENYYSWQWGDALFIVLDPFRFTNDNKSPWLRTLGSDQYIWLKKTLEGSKAKFKFVFIHNLVGGADKKGIARGGIEAAKYFEWGGLDINDINKFKTYRPDWELPIHDLLIANKVDIVFHGHDHFFAKQDLDGMVYQLLPQPGALRYGNINSAAEYGYQQGKILNHPGYLRVSIKNDFAIIEDIQTSINNQYPNKEILYSYKINGVN